MGPERTRVILGSGSLALPPTLDERVEALGWPIVDLPVFATRYGVQVSMAGERIVGQDVDDQGVENLPMPHSGWKTRL
jgi:hypothetical protein